MLPPSLDELIPADHVVRVVDKAIDKMDIGPLLDTYKGGGTSSYHPRMMLKVIVYGYIQKKYSSRAIAKALREDINFMWISGMNRPDFRTINLFRSSRLKETIDRIFSSILELLLDAGFVKMENYFLDGTKIEANANKYSFVWKRATEKNKIKLQVKIRGLLKEIDECNEEENSRYGSRDLEELGGNGTITSEMIEQTAREIDEKLAHKPADKQLRKAAKTLKSDYIPRTRKYEQQEKLFGDRNSYSKTDTDATFMRMKEDHMKNGQLKAGYNVQTGTENQFIVGYSVHQKPGDSGFLMPHLDHLEKLAGKLPRNIVADAGYGCEENYDYLEEKKLGNYVKFNNFHFEQKRIFKKNAFRVENLKYDEQNDEFKCPNGKTLRYTETRKTITENGFETTRDQYRCEDCSDCQLREECHGGRGNRNINVSHKLNRHKETARKNLTSEKGKELRSLRPVEVESVFGQIKNNSSFRRFLLRGLEKVKTEWGLICVAHNLRKMAFNLALLPKTA